MPSESPARELPLVNCREELERLYHCLRNNGSTLLLPESLHRSICDALQYLEHEKSRTPPKPTVSNVSTANPPSNLVQQPGAPRTENSVTPPPTIAIPGAPSGVLTKNVRLSKKTYLSKLYTFDDPSVVFEFPESAEDRPVGYLFRNDMSQPWRDRYTDFVYSLGAPGGRTSSGKYRTCQILDTKVERDPESGLPLIPEVHCCVLTQTCKSSPNLNNLKLIFSSPLLELCRTADSSESINESQCLLVDVTRWRRRFRKALYVFGQALLKKFATW